MFSVSFLEPGEDDTVHRRIRVLTRAGSLYSVSQNMPGLQWTLAWKPSGAVIAAPIRKPNKQVIAFFEKNGLEHGTFDISSDTKVTNLSWSPDSNILAVSSPDTIYLYAVKNYHWYLKQKLYLGENILSYSLRWSEDSETLQCLLTADEKVMRLHSWRMIWVTDVTQVCESSWANVAVVDGSKVLVTPFRQVTVPPPSSAYTIQCDGAVSYVVFLSALSDDKVTKENLLSVGSRDLNNFLLVTCTGQVHVMITDQSKITVNDVVSLIDNNVTPNYSIRYQKHGYLGTFQLPSKTLENIVWCGCYIVASHGNQIILISGENQLESLSMEEDVYTITAQSVSSIIVQLIDGSLVNISIEDENLSIKDSSIKWPGVCSTVIACSKGVIGLTERFKLYLDNRELATNVTSASLNSSYLLVTTLDHYLLTIHLDQLTNAADFGSAASGKRRVERGSRLVCSVPTESKTVLQMPRGNIEVVHPRALTIVLLTDLLDKRQFKDAFMLARTQRINLNLLVDHNIEMFLENCEEFVDQVGNSDYLSIFIADLLEESVCKTLYNDQFKTKPDKAAPKNKVNSVCSKLREVFVKRDKEKYLLPTLASYVRDGRNLEKALAVLKSYKDANQKTLVDSGLRFLATMVDINQLFNVALGTYDLQMVVMVAEKSQKDPKEYLPFLNNFRKMEDNFRQFSIDQHLERNESALNHIIKCPDKSNLCHEFIVKHRLFKQALTLLPPKSDEYKQVCLSYGEYLESKKYYEEASIMYQKSEHLDQAVNQAKAGLCWERAGYLAKAADWSNDKLLELFGELASQLETAGRYQDAAAVLKDWCQDEEESVAVLVRGFQWTQSVNMVRNMNRSDLIQTHVGPGLLERREKLVSSLETYSEQLIHHVERLQVVIQSRIHENDDELDDDNVDIGRNVDDADMFSDTTSVQQSVTSTVKSRSTLKTRTTSRSKASKNRRKAERKIFTTKEGSQYEDIGIIAAVHELITTVVGIRDEVRQVVRALVEVGHEKLVPSTQKTMEDILNLIDKNIPLVWKPEDPNKNDADMFGPEHTVEEIIQGKATKQEYTPPINLLPPHLRYPPVIKKDNSWKLEIF